MNQPAKNSTVRTPDATFARSGKNPGRIFPLASGHHPPRPNSRRQRITSPVRHGGTKRCPADAAELRPPPRILGEDVLVHIRHQHDVVVDQKDRIPRRSVDTDVALHGEPTRSGMYVVEREPGSGAEALDLRPAERLLA